jgi:hypothetical protein
MKVKFIPLIAVLAAGLILVAPSAAAPPATTSVQLDSKATLVTSGTIVLHVVLECPAGTSGSVHAGVSQQHPVGPNTSGFGSMSVMCTGSKQTLNLLVVGADFTTGDAFAGVEAVDIPVQSFGQDQRVITIS